MAELGLAEGFCPYCGASTHDHCVEHGITDEREACAALIDGFRLKWIGYDVADEFGKAAAEIRARGNS